MAATSACLAVLVAIAWRGADRGWGPLALAIGAALAVPVGLRAVAPGAAVEPSALIVVAAAAGIHAGFAARSSGARPGPWSWAWPVAGAGAWVGLRAVWQRVAGLDALASEVARTEGVPYRELVLERLAAGRAFAAFATPAALGGFLAISLPVTVGLAIGAAGRRRVAAFAAAALQAAALVATASATAVGALVVALVVAGLRWAGSRRVAVAGAALAGAVLGAVVLVRGPALLSASDPESPWRLRAGNFRIAAEMIADRPWAGTGPGGYAELYASYRLPGDNEARHAHDLPLELSAELGLPLGLALSALFFAAFLGPLLGRNPPSGHPAKGLAIGLGAFAVQNLGDFTAFFPSLLWTAALLRGWALADDGVRADAPRLPAAISAACLAATVLATAISAASGLAWNGRIEARSSLSRGDVARAAEVAAAAVRLAPWNPDGRGLVLAARLAAPPGEPDREAALRRHLREADAAVAASPVRAAFRHGRARVRAALGDVPGAWADLRRTADLHPARTEYAEERDAFREAAARWVARGEERP